MEFCAIKTLKKIKQLYLIALILCTIEAEEKGFLPMKNIAWTDKTLSKTTGTPLFKKIACVMCIIITHK